MAQKKEHVQTHYLPTESYLATRAAALHFPAKQFADMINDMPINPVTLSTLVVYINGAANVYFNNGGSYTGASQRYQTVVQAGRLLVANASRILGECSQTTSFPLPTSQPHHLYLLTKKGIFEKKVLPSAIKEESEDMQAIYFLYQQVMRELRSAQLKDQAMSQK